MSEIIYTRYLWYAGALTGPFAENVPATVIINGRLFTQMEQASTNNIGYSEDFGEWTAIGSASVTEDQAVAPDGNTTADKLTFTADAADGIKRVLADTITDDTPQTVSVWAKTASGTKTFRIGYLKKDGNAAVSSDLTATTTWQRFDYTLSDILNGGTTPEARIINGTGAAAGDLLIWGAQSENNRQWPSSYIPALAGNAVTRVADSFHWAPADIPSRIKTGDWQFKVIPYWAKGENTAGFFGPTYDADNGLYWDTVNDKLKVYDGGVAKVASNALDWARGTMLKVRLDADSGAIEVSGASSGSGMVYGSLWDWSDCTGDLYYQGDGERIDGLISEPY